ncbi:MAG TPA: GNAT family N-acetyltransferase [Verrucomicrobiae bacterium]|jgi:hypothetical protein|nr:GNAT family N-acetyltransferase [Verrucomicrobiae bacterium]
MLLTDEKAGPPVIEDNESGVEIINPLQRADWDSLVDVLPGSTVFHGSGWARVLNETYGHSPMYFCRFAGNRLAEALPLMEVSSKWTGHRGVSLPFTDLCPALCDADSDGRHLYRAAVTCGSRRRWKTLECRGSNDGWERSTPSLVFMGHVVDLGSGEAALLKSFAEDIRRGIRKAEKSDVQVRFETSLEAVKIFYGLHCLTRRKHGVPPQPWRFFENVHRYLLAPERGFVATAYYEGKPTASAVFFHQGKGAFYKFGASDEAFLQLRPNNLMMWESMRHYMNLGYKSLHMGRTSLANEGLRRFKTRFGAREETIQYRSYHFGEARFVTKVDRAKGWFNRVFGFMPLPLLRLAGEILYPHLS